MIEAPTQQVQIEQLLRVLEVKCAELRSLKGSENELQRTLELLNRVTREALSGAPTAAPRDTDKVKAATGQSQSGRSQFGGL